MTLEGQMILWWKNTEKIELRIAKWNFDKICNPFDLKNPCFLALSLSLSHYNLNDHHLSFFNFFDFDASISTNIVLRQWHAKKQLILIEIMTILSLVVTVIAFRIIAFSPVGYYILLGMGSIGSTSNYLSYHAT